MKRPDNIAPHMRWTTMYAAREALCTHECDKWLPAAEWNALYGECGSGLAVAEWSKAEDVDGQAMIAFPAGNDEWLVIGREP